jgi:serine/threonine protein kinase
MTATRNPPQTPRLRQSGSGLHGKALPTHKMRLILGRGTTADVVLTDDGASRAHACIAWNGQAWSIEDLGSRNGTKVNEDVLRGNRPLRDGDRIRIGKTELVFELQISPGVVSANDRGTRIDNCTLLERLDSGTTGEVWRVKDDQNRERAIKIIKPSLASNPEALQTFIEGGRAQMRLLHPNVLPIHAVTPGVRPVIVMALARHSLGSYLQAHGTITPSACLVLAKSLASALHAASQVQLTHRALHPGNILLDDQHRAMLTDFALLGAEAPLSARKSHAVWLAPEEVTGGACDDLANQCRLGLVLWHAITGIIPYAGEDPLAVARSRLTGNLAGLERVSGMPDALPHLLTRLLCRDPHQRFSDWLDVQRAVERVEAGGELPEVRQDSLLRLPQPSEHTRVSRRAKARPEPDSLTPSAQAVKTTERIHAGGSSARLRSGRRAPRTVLAVGNLVGVAVVVVLTVAIWEYLHRNPSAGEAAKHHISAVVDSARTDDSTDDAAAPTPPASVTGPDGTIKRYTPLATSLPSLVPDGSGASPQSSTPVLGPASPASTAPTGTTSPPASTPAIVSATQMGPTSAGSGAAASAPTAAPAAIAGPPSSDAPTLPAATMAMPALQVHVLMATEIGGDGDQMITSVSFDAQGRLTARGTGFSAVINPHTGTAAIHGDINTHAAVVRPASPAWWTQPVTLPLGGGMAIRLAQRQDEGQRLPSLGTEQWSWWSLDARRSTALGLGSDALLTAAFARPDQQFVVVGWAEAANSCLARDPRDSQNPLPLARGRHAAQDAATYVLRGNGGDGALLSSFVLAGTALAAATDPWGRIYLASSDRGRDQLGLAGDAGVCVVSPDLGQVLLDARLGGRVSTDSGWEAFTSIAYHDGMLALGGSTCASSLPESPNALQRRAGGGQDGLLVVLQLWDATPR